MDAVLIVVCSFEKVEDNDASKSSSSGRNKKPVKKKVMEYCFEPEMEEVTVTYIELCSFFEKYICFLFHQDFRCLLSFV